MSGRRFTEERDATGLTVFTFEAGQEGFASPNPQEYGHQNHRKRLDRMEHYIERGGDWRGNPTGMKRVHTRPEFWVESFSENQDRLRPAGARMTHLFDFEFLWDSNAPWYGTGYGGQSAIWGPRLRDLFAPGKFAMVGYAGMQHQHVEWQGIPVFPAGVENAIGMDVLGYYYEKLQAEAIIALCDAWALSPRCMRS